LGSRSIERIEARIDSLPDWLRPAAFGALFIVAFAMMRGAWIILPIVVIYVFATDPAPWQFVAHGFAIAGLAMLAGGLSGLAYGLVGRHIQRAFVGGWYLTGVVTATPYAILLTYIDRLFDHKPLLAPLAGQDLGLSAGLALFIGIVIGHSWFAPGK
jgi:hypothetical protein